MGTRSLEEGMAFLRAEVSRMFFGVTGGEVAADKLIIHTSQGSICVYVVEARFSKGIDALISAEMESTGEPRHGNIPRLNDN
jgi:hypothetical protein